MLHLIPTPIARALLPLAHKIRHRWRKWRKLHLRGVSAILTDFDGAVLLLRHSYGPSVWSLPGGGLGRNEDPESAIRREVREELGIELGVVKSLGTMEETISGCSHTAYVFTAICRDQPIPDGREVTEARFFPSHSLPEPLGDQARQRLALWREKGMA